MSNIDLKAQDVITEADGLLVFSSLHDDILASVLCFDEYINKKEAHKIFDKIFGNTYYKLLGYSINLLGERDTTKGFTTNKTYYAIGYKKICDSKMMTPIDFQITQTLLHKMMRNMEVIYEK